MTTTTNFEFRSKFKKLLNDDELKIITHAFNNFCDREPDDVCDILWELTYSENIGCLAIMELGLIPKIISPENIFLTRNELRFQYEFLHPNFLNVKVPDECIEEFNTLKNHSSPIVAKVVYEKCYGAIYGDEYQKMYSSEIDRILFLLKSEKDNNYFGGIRGLHFKTEEAEYLKPFHTYIYNLFAKLNSICKEKSIEFPLYMDGEEESDNSKTIIDDNIVLEIPFKRDYNDEKDKQEIKSILPIDILEHKEIFKSFVETGDFNKLIPIGNLGFDLNEIVLKKEKINKFIKATDDLIN